MKAIRWLEANLRLFDPTDHTRDGHASALKAFGELVLCLAVARRLAPPCFPSQRLVSFVAGMIDEISVCRLASHARTYAMVFDLETCARDLGIATPRLSRHIADLEPLGARSMPERSPFAELEAAYFSARRRGTQPTFPKRTVARTAFSRLQSDRFPSWLLDTSDIYNVTHTIFYLTDFGNMKMATPVSRAFTERLTGLLALHVLRRDWDLAGELLMCLRLLDIPASPVQRAADEAIRASQLPDGRIPYRLPMDDRTPIDFSYHTTLVFLICALFRHRGANAPHR